MSKDYIGYQALADSAMRGIVREALKTIEKKGLIGNHHFFITYKTKFPGVEMPDFLKEQYPEEITIVLQHEFWGLAVADDAFEVVLKFRKMPATLRVPFAALTAFIDKGANFGLQFQQQGEEKALGQPGKSAETPPLLAGAPKDQPAKKSPFQRPEEEKAPADAEKPVENEKQAPGEVVSLDKFRKK